MLAIYSLLETLLKLDSFRKYRSKTTVKNLKKRLRCQSGVTKAWWYDWITVMRNRSSLILMIKDVFRYEINEIQSTIFDWLAISSTLLCLWYYLISWTFFLSNFRSSNHLYSHFFLPFQVSFPVNLHELIVVQVSENSSVDQRRNEESERWSQSIMNLYIECLWANGNDYKEIKLN